MNRLKLLLVLFVFSGFSALMAQTVTIKGTVTSADDGLPIPGVAVKVKGTTIGTLTDNDGKYSINVPTSTTTLSFNFVGMQPVEETIGGRSTIDVVMASAVLGLDEVVVTALGITREKRALGYAVQDVNGAALSKAGSGNTLSALGGRFSGIQVTSASGQMGGGSRVLVRGASSMTMNNQPLYVVDGVPLDNSDFSYGATGGGGYDFGNTATDLNTEDIESISVLKGAGATALYGSRAANGVILVTTKKAKLEEKKTLGVSVNSTVTYEKAAIYPKLQKLYGGGVTYSDADGGVDGFLTANINGTEYKLVEYATDESWGPKYDPSIMVLQWNAFDSWDTQHYLKPTPWVYPKHDYTYFFRTGISYQNNFQINGSNEKSAFRLSYTNLNQHGIYVNSSLQKNVVSFSGTTKPNKVLDAFINVNYLVNTATGRPETGYGDNNPVQKMWQWCQNSLDYKDLEAYMNPDGSQRSWNRISYEDPGPNYTDNPYWSRYKNYETDRRDRIYGNAGFNITMLPWLKFTGRFGIDYYDFRMETRVAVGSQAQSYYDNDARQNLERNLEGFFTLNKRFSNDLLGVNAIFGANRMDRDYWRTGGYTDGGLVIPGIYVLTNSKNSAIIWDYKSQKRINSLYGNVTLDYNRMIYLDLTSRNDWSSTLPAANRSYLYSSANLSFILSELPALKSVKWLSLAKVRAGVAKVGSDTDAYSSDDYYNIQIPFGSNPRLSVPTNKANLNLKPEQTKSWEVGAEMSMLENRLGFEVTYYQRDTYDQIIPIQVSATTGYAAFFTNSGKMSNKGLEINLKGTPIAKGDFRWDISLNMGTLHNKVDEVSRKYGLTYLSLGNAPFKVQVGAFEGQTYPIIYGTDYVKDKAGNKLIDPETGLYSYTPVKPIGNVSPTFTAGLSNTISYKGFDLSVLIDMQKGGHIYYLSNAWGMYSGLLEETAATNENGKNIRDAVSAGGGILCKGVYGYYDATNGFAYADADGNASTTAVANTVRAEGMDYCSWFYDGPDAQNVFKTDFFKLREIALGYTVPAKYTGPVKGVRISVFGRNLATWGQQNKHFDPEYLQMAGSNAQGSEGGYLPSTKTFGFGLNFNF